MEEADLIQFPRRLPSMTFPGDLRLDPRYQVDEAGLVKSLGPGATDRPPSLARLRNISLRGAMIRVEDPFRAGDRVILAFALGTGIWEGMARVHSCDPEPGSGYRLRVRFHSIDRPSQAVLSSFVQGRSMEPAPSVTERDPRG